MHRLMAGDGEQDLKMHQKVLVVGRDLGALCRNPNVWNNKIVT